MRCESTIFPREHSLSFTIESVEGKRPTVTCNARHETKHAPKKELDKYSSTGVFAVDPDVSVQVLTNYVSAFRQAFDILEVQLPTFSMLLGQRHQM